MHVGTAAEADASLPDVPAWPWREKPDQGFGLDKGETPQQWSLLSCYFLEPKEFRQQLQCLGGAILSFFFLLALASRSFTLYVLTNPALLVCDTGKVAMQQGGSSCFDASKAAFRVMSWFKPSWP